MKSICYIHKDIATIDRGGLCVLFKTLAKGLREKGWEVSVITSQELKMEGVTSYIIPKKDDPDEYSREVTKLLESIKPDIAECSIWRFELIDLSRIPDHKPKIVVRCDPSTSTLFPSTTKYDSGEQELCQNADLLIAVSKFARQDIEKKYSVKDIKLVYNGVDEINLKQLSNEFIDSGEILHLDSGTNEVIKNFSISNLVNNKSKTYVFWIGKPTKMKGFDLLEKIVQESGSKVQFIVNIGYAFDEVKWKRENYKKCIFVRGFSKIDQLTLFKTCDVFLSTSRAEGFGIAVSEGLSLGLPVLLNKDCEVFKEFLPNPAVQLIDVNSPQDVIKKVIDMSKDKVNYSRNPEIFKNSHMVEESIKAYLSIL